MLPPAAVMGAATAAHSRERQAQIRNSLIGNSLHVPSIMLALILLLQLVPAQSASATSKFSYGHAEQELRTRVRHTALKPGITQGAQDS